MKVQDLLAKLRDPSITNIEIYETECDDKEYLEHLQAIKDACAANTSLQSIIINPHGRDIYSSGEIAKQVVCVLMTLLKNSNLHKFALNHHFLIGHKDNNGVYTLVENLVRNKTLKELRIHQCRMGSDAEMLVPILARMKLNSLDLSENNISGKCLLGLFYGYGNRMDSTDYKLKSSLTYLCLEHNSINDEDLAQILRILLAQQNLKLNGCYLIDNNYDRQDIDDHQDKIYFAWNPSRSTEVLQLWDQLATKRQFPNREVKATGSLPEEFILRMKTKEILIDFNNGRPLTTVGTAYNNSRRIYEDSDELKKLALNSSGKGPDAHYGYIELEKLDYIEKIKSDIAKLRCEMDNLRTNASLVSSKEAELRNRVGELQNTLAELTLESNNAAKATSSKLKN